MGALVYDGTDKFNMSTDECLVRMVNWWVKGTTDPETKDLPLFKEFHKDTAPMFQVIVLMGIWQELGRIREAIMRQ